MSGSAWKSGEDRAAPVRCIGKYSLDCIEAMYESYHKLGGNGFIKSIMQETRELSVK